MPLLEMALVFNNIYHGLSRCFSPNVEKFHSSHQSVSFSRKKMRSRRRKIEKPGRGSRHLRAKRFPVGEESDQTESISSDQTELLATPTFASSPKTLNPVPVIPSYELQQRLLLQQRPLMTNARQAVTFQLTSWWYKAWPTLVSASVQLSFGSSIINHSLLGEFEEGESPALTIIIGITQALKRVCNHADNAISNTGPGPSYIPTSPAMELIDLNDVVHRLNNVLVDYLMANFNTEVSQVE
nr:uncharacterized protein LOC108130367 [Drosophila bipectinata]